MLIFQILAQTKLIIADAPLTHTFVNCNVNLRMNNVESKCSKYLL